MIFKTTTKGMLYEGFKITTHITCTSMFSTQKNTSLASLLLPVSFKNLAINKEH